MSPHRSRQDATRRAAGQIRVERVAVLHAAAVFVDQLADGDARRRNVHARLLHSTRHRERAQPLASVASVPREPFDAHARPCRAPGTVSPCCARAWGAQTARPGRHTGDEAVACRACPRSIRSSPTLRRRCRRRRRGAGGSPAASPADRPSAARARARAFRGTHGIHRAGRCRSHRCRPPRRRSASLRRTDADCARGNSDP